MSSKKILILGNSKLVVFGFRGELISKLVECGHDVWTCFPNGPFGEGETAATAYGCHFIENKMERKGTNPIRELHLIWDYNKIIKELKPDLVLAYTVKPDVYGGIVCSIHSIPFMLNVTGLGKGLDEKGIIKQITVMLYKYAAKNAKCIFFQNDHDRKFFEDVGINYKKQITLPGSGVNLEKYKAMPYPAENEPIRFVYVARVMKAKGIEQFFEAAHAIRQKYPETEFHVCGYCEENYKEEIERRTKCGDIFYHGLVENIQDVEKDCHCIVLPSFHPEGISNVLLEGAAGARPLITTDHPGCRETVTDGVTGYVVKPRSSEDLKEKMISFIKLPYSEKVKMGIAGRKKVESEFDRQIVVKAYLNEINNMSC